jgi:hypothetical protein
MKTFHVNVGQTIGRCPVAFQAIIAIVLLLCTMPAWSARMPRGSFLAKPVYSAAQLATQLRTNPTVASRYERHFGIAAPQLAQYAQTQLGLRRLPRGGRYRVFFIKPDGSIGSKTRFVRKGTPVFLHLRSGQAVLLGDCGNPMTSVLPGYAPPRRVTVMPPTATAPPLLPPQEPPAPEPAVQTTPFALPDPTATAPLEPVTLSLWQAEPLAAPVEPVVEARIASRKAVPVLPFLLIVGLGLAEGSGATSNPPAPIPEPASAASLFVGMALLAIARRRALRRTGSLR